MSRLRGETPPPPLKEITYVCLHIRACVRTCLAELYKAHLELRRFILSLLCVQSPRHHAGLISTE